MKAICEFRKFSDQPLTLRGADYAHAVQELNKAIDRANGLLQSRGMCGPYRRTTTEEEIARQYHIAIPPLLDFRSATTSLLARSSWGSVNPDMEEWSLGALGWGLIPSWKMDKKIAY